MQTYIALQMRHMRFEENQLFPLLDQGLDNSDWNALTNSVGSPDQDEPEDRHVLEIPTAVEYWPGQRSEELR